jgi:Tol biopolymer transport system component
LSFDRKSIAYTYYVVPKDPKDLGGSDLYVMDATGANSRVVRPHPEAGATWEDPCFTADGKAILATLRKPIYTNGQFQGETLSIQRAGLDGGEPTTLLSDGFGPSTSPDGKFLVYTAVDPKGQPTTLRIADATGSGAKDLFPTNQSFTYARFPSFSPDGGHIVFSAVTGSSSLLPAPKVRSSPFEPAIAEAHGIPWEIWTVRPDGSELTQRTHESEDTPIPVWSPNGDWIAFAGEIGLYLVDSAGKQTMRLSTTVSGGGVVWLT